MFGKPKNEQEWLGVAKKMFIMGFFLLPGVWLVMLCQFRDHWRKQSQVSRQIRNYMLWAAIGSVVQFGVALLWMIVYLSKWQSWGAAGDSLNVIVYSG